MTKNQGLTDKEIIDCVHNDNPCKRRRQSDDNSCSHYPYLYYEEEMDPETHCGASLELQFDFEVQQDEDNDLLDNINRILQERYGVDAIIDWRDEGTCWIHNPRK